MLDYSDYDMDNSQLIEVLMLNLNKNNSSKYYKNIVKETKCIIMWRFRIEK